MPAVDYARMRAAAQQQQQAYNQRRILGTARPGYDAMVADANRRNAGNTAVSQSIRPPGLSFFDQQAQRYPQLANAAAGNVPMSLQQSSQPPQGWAAENARWQLIHGSNPNNTAFNNTLGNNQWWDANGNPTANMPQNPILGGGYPTSDTFGENEWYGEVGAEGYADGRPPRPIAWNMQNNPLMRSGTAGLRDPAQMLSMYGSMNPANASPAAYQRYNPAPGANMRAAPNAQQETLSRIFGGYGTPRTQVMPPYRRPI